MTRKRKVIIIDDSEMDRMILAEILKTGFDVAVYENGYMALEKLMKEKNLPDCILLDINMPVLDGFQVLTILREHRIQIPVFLITAEATRENVSRAAEFGIQGFMAKPFQAEAILSRLRAFFHIEGEEDQPEEEHTDPYEITEEVILATNELVLRLNNFYSIYMSDAGITDTKYRRVSGLVELLIRRHAAISRDPLYDEAHIQLISQAAYYYDIGIMTYPQEFTRVNEEEAAGHPQHTVGGSHLICLNTSPLCRFFVDVCSDICMHHHERADGSGFPHRLLASDIRLPAQITGLCIEFDRIFTHRSEFNELNFTFTMNELLIRPEKFSDYAIRLLTECEKEIVRFYNTKFFRYS